MFVRLTFVVDRDTVAECEQVAREMTKPYEDAGIVKDVYGEISAIDFVREDDDEGQYPLP